MDFEETAQSPEGQPQAVDNTTHQPDRTQRDTTTLSADNDPTPGPDTLPQSSSTEPPLPSLPSEDHHAPPALSHSQSGNILTARYARSRDGHVHMSSQLQTKSTASNGGLPQGPLNNSGIDWIVPVDVNNTSVRHTVGDRLQSTIDNAVTERDRYARKVLWTGYALNIAIGLQVLLGALTTAISAAVSTVKQAQIATAVLGALATLVASYLARARGSGQPELSIALVKDLENFLRESRAFQLDYAHEYPTVENGLEDRLISLRQKFEELLGNASGERKLSPVGIDPNQGAKSET